MPNRMEQMVSKGMGKAKEAKAGLSGLKGVFRTLAEQHGEVSALLKRAKISKDAEKRADLWQKIRLELLSHEKGEMQEVYSVLEKEPETRDLAKHHNEEAEELETMIHRMDGIDTSSDEWSDMLTEIADTVLHHASEEEDEIFPKAQKVIGEDRAKELEPKFMEAKKRVMNHV